MAKEQEKQAARQVADRSAERALEFLEPPTLAAGGSQMPSASNRIEKNACELQASSHPE